MYKIVCILAVVFLAGSCGVQHQLKRSYSGKPVSALDSGFGKPVAVFETAGDSVYLFEKTEQLAGTEISQGRLALDPIVTPRVSKTERFYFTVRKGIIVKTRFEEEYKR